MISGYRWNRVFEIQIISIGDLPEARAGLRRGGPDVLWIEPVWPKPLKTRSISLAFDRGWPLRYGVAPSTVALALAARALLTPVLHDDAIFFYFIPPVLISAGIGGLGPGLLATALSLAAALFLVVRRRRRFRISF